MRAILFSLVFAFSATLCLGQRDTARPASPPANPPILTPGIDSPISAPGTMMQSSTRTPLEKPNRKNRKHRIRTEPLNDPRAFGVAIPLENPKKDSTRRRKP